MAEIATINWFGKWEASVFSENTAVFSENTVIFIYSKQVSMSLKI